MTEIRPSKVAPRRAMLLALVGLLALAALGVYAWRASIPDGFVVDLLALEDGSALVVLRHNEDAGPSFWLVTLSRDGDATSWVALDMEIETASGSPSLARAGDLIAVRGMTTEHHVIVAYAIGSLEPRWRTDLGAAEEDIIPDLGLYSVADLLYATRDGGEGARVAAIEPATGAVRWEASLPVETMGVSAPIAAGTSVAFLCGSAVVVIDAATGSVTRTIPFGSLACVSEAGVLATMGDDGLTEVGAEGDSDRVVLSRADVGAAVTGATGVGAEHRCGTRDGRYVFTPLSMEWSGLVGVDATGARPPWSLPLPTLRETTMVQGRVAWRWPGRTPLTGALTRFVPMVVEHVPDPSVPPEVLSPLFLAILDLDEQRIVSLSPGSPWLLHFGIATVGGRHYIADSDEIALLDGASGEVIAAVALEGWTREWLTPAAVAGGRVWLVGTDWAGVHDLPVAILDAATLAPITVRGEITVEDHLAEARALLIGPAS